MRVKLADMCADADTLAAGLKENGSQHRRYKLYTSMERALGILVSGNMYFSNGSRWNDLQDRQLMARSHQYGGCFSWSTVENIADLFDLIGWNVEYHAATDLKFDTIEGFERSVIDYIDRGIPIMVDWVDWAGHWQVIIGIDTCGSDTPYDDVLIFADPYDITDHYQDGYYIFPMSRFFGMWREGPCAGKEKPYSQPFVIAYPGDGDRTT